jgi:hypothetical protein
LFFFVFWWGGGGAGVGQSYWPWTWGIMPQMRHFFVPAFHHNIKDDTHCTSSDLWTLTQCMHNMMQDDIGVSAILRCFRFVYVHNQRCALSSVHAHNMIQDDIGVSAILRCFRFVYVHNQRCALSSLLYVYLRIKRDECMHYLFCDHCLFFYCVAYVKCVNIMYSL